MLNAGLNDETGELMEYRHLVSNPKYRDTWKNAYHKAYPASSKAPTPLLSSTKQASLRTAGRT
jgi:hypothetical protein